MLTHAEIDQAATRLRPHVRRTPIMSAEIAGQHAALKLEFLQHTGSFKARGAFNRLASATLPQAGVVAASGGNHGAAVAFAARALGSQAAIFVPSPTPPAKLARIASYGAHLVQGGANYAEALEASRLHRDQTGALEVHAYDDPAVLAGQGTIGRELEADAPALTHILVAVGGGGLIGGIASWYAGKNVQIIGVEPESCPTWNAAQQAGHPIPVQVGGLAADSLGARQIGTLMFETATRTGVQSILVPDSAIAAAQAYLWSQLRIIAEPGGATALAALLSNTWPKPPTLKSASSCVAPTRPQVLRDTQFAPSSEGRGSG